ncbi:polysaccharide deacetylase family protein [Microbacterium sp. HJ5]
MIVNLCFHGVGICPREHEPGEAGYWMSQDIFLRVLDLVAPLEDVRLSFDDGNRSDVDVALPALRDRGLTATFFPLAGRLDDPASLDSADLRGLRAAGMPIGSHGWTHTTWRDLTDVEAGREFLEARKALEEASGATITEAAFPLGGYDRTALRRLKSAGYRTVYSSDRYPARRSAWMQARYSVTAADTVDSVARIARRRPGMHELRNVLASTVKRMR